MLAAGVPARDTLNPVPAVRPKKLTYGLMLAAAILPPVIRIDLGLAPYGRLKVMAAAQPEAGLPVPVVIVTEPAESVEPAVIAVVGEVPQDIPDMATVGAIP